VVLSRGNTQGLVNIIADGRPLWFFLSKLHELMEFHGLPHCHSAKTSFLFVIFQDVFNESFRVHDLKRFRRVFGLLFDKFVMDNTNKL